MSRTPHLSEEGQRLVASMLTYFERERDYGGPLLPLSSPRDRVADALQLSLSTVNRIAVKRYNPSAFERKPRKRSKPVLGMDDCNKNAIRNVVYDIYKNKERVTLDNLKLKLRERELFYGSRTSLNLLLKNLGFCYKNRKLVLEGDDLNPVVISSGDDDTDESSTE